MKTVFNAAVTRDLYQGNAQTQGAWSFFRKQHRHVLCLHYNSAWPMDLYIGPWLEQIAHLSKEVCLYAGADWLTPVSQRVVRGQSLRLSLHWSALNALSRLCFKLPMMLISSSRHRQRGISGRQWTACSMAETKNTYRHCKRNSTTVGNASADLSTFPVTTRYKNTKHCHVQILTFTLGADRSTEVCEGNKWTRPHVHERVKRPCQGCRVLPACTIPGRYC